jgi:hypothetical protein
MRAQSTSPAMTTGPSRTDELLAQLIARLDEVDRRLDDVSRAVNAIRDMMDGSKFTATGSTPNVS